MFPSTLLAKDFNPETPQTKDKPFAIVGVKACDLKGFKIQDYVFKDHDYQDPFYIKNREQNLIIGADCTCAIDTCFCLALGVRPYPQEDFDINLSVVQGGYVVEIGSEKGKALVAKHPSLFEETKAAFDREKDSQRARVIKEVEENIKKYDIPHQDLFEGRGGIRDPFSQWPYKTSPSSLPQLGQSLYSHPWFFRFGYFLK